MKMTEKNTGALLGTNPYNKNKEWDDEGKTGEEFVSADESMAYVKNRRTAVISDGTENEGDPAPAATPTETDTPDSKYNRTDWKKRYDDLKRHHDRRINEFKKREGELEQKVLDNQPTYTPPTTKEELEAFRKENPGIYNVVETVAHLQAQEKLESLGNTVENLQEKLALAEAEKAYAELQRMVPDFEEIRQDPAFHKWADEQPEEIQNWIYQNRSDARLAAKAINMYKADVGSPTRATSTATGSAADYVPVHKGQEQSSPEAKIWTRKEIAQLSPSQFEAQEAEIQQAYVEGRIQG